MGHAMDNPAPPDVFISYSRGDRDRAQWYSEWCVAQGWSVWWDQVIAPGRKWDQAIERALSEARCVLVLWSATSVASDWVRTEASEAARRGVLVPVLIDRVEPPLEFRRVQALDLSGWDGRSDEPALALLRTALAEHIGGIPVPAATPRPMPRSAPSHRVVAGAAVLVAIAIGIWKWPLRPAPAAVPPVPAPASALETNANGRSVEGAGKAATRELPIPAQARASVEPDRPLQQPEPSSNQGRSGAEPARLAEAQHQALLDKAEQSRSYWPYVLKDEGGALILEQ